MGYVERQGIKTSCEHFQPSTTLLILMPLFYHLDPPTQGGAPDLLGGAERSGCGLGSHFKVKSVNHSHSSSVCLSQEGLSATSSYKNLEGYESF